MEKEFIRLNYIVIVRDEDVIRSAIKDEVLLQNLFGKK